MIFFLFFPFTFILYLSNFLSFDGIIKYFITINFYLILQMLFFYCEKTLEYHYYCFNFKFKEIHYLLIHFTIKNSSFNCYCLKTKNFVYFLLINHQFKFIKIIIIRDSYKYYSLIFCCLSVIS
jgi:hypothetical protein